MAGQTAGPIKTKLGIGTHVYPRSVFVKVKVIWRHLVNANKTPYRGPQGPREIRAQSAQEACKGRENSSSLFRPEDGYLQLVNNNINWVRGIVLDSVVTQWCLFNRPNFSWVMLSVCEKCSYSVQNDK